MLQLFLEKEVQTKEMILKNLKSESGEHIQNRVKELEEEMIFAQRALDVYL